MKQNIRNELLELIDAERISKENIDEVLDVSEAYSTTNEFLNFLKIVLVWLGATALVLALLFFMAFNWHELGRISKFMMIEAIMATLIIFYIFLDNYKFIQQVLLMILTVVLGILLALIGQTYQTGADPWQLFAFWAFFMSPWAVVARFSGIWLLWIVLLNLSTILYYQKFDLSILMFSRGVDELVLLIFALNSFLWIIWALLSKKYSAFQDRFIINILAFLSFFTISTLFIKTFDLSFHFNALNKWFPLLYIVFMASVYYLYRVRTLNIYMMSLYALSLFLVSLNILIPFIIMALASNIILLLLSLLVLIVGLTILMVSWLKSLKRSSK